MTRGRIPDRWEEYSGFGSVVRGTRFIPFKVPLNEKLCEKLPQDIKWFTPDQFVGDLQNQNLKLGLVIDLTNTTRYYDKQEVEKHGIKYAKIFTEGHLVPSQEVKNNFFEAVDNFTNSNDQDLIGVHCTHGINRTGYLVCRYMIDRLNVEPTEAINAFNEARGYNIERINYLEDLQGIERVHKHRCSTCGFEGSKGGVLHHRKRVHRSANQPPTGEEEELLPTGVKRSGPADGSMTDSLPSVDLSAAGVPQTGLSKSARRSLAKKKKKLAAAGNVGDANGLGAGGSLIDVKMRLDEAEKMLDEVMDGSAHPPTAIQPSLVKNAKAARRARAKKAAAAKKKLVQDGQFSTDIQLDMMGPGFSIMNGMDNLDRYLSVAGISSDFHFGGSNGDGIMDCSVPQATLRPSAHLPAAGVTPTGLSKSARRSLAKKKKKLAAGTANQIVNSLEGALTTSPQFSRMEVDNIGDGNVERNTCLVEVGVRSEDVMAEPIGVSMVRTISKAARRRMAKKMKERESKTTETLATASQYSNLETDEAMDKVLDGIHKIVFARNLGDPQVQEDFHSQYPDVETKLVGSLIRACQRARLEGQGEKAASRRSRGGVSKVASGPTTGGSNVEAKSEVAAVALGSTADEATINLLYSADTTLGVNVIQNSSAEVVSEAVKAEQPEIYQGVQVGDAAEVLQSMEHPYSSEISDEMNRLD